MTLSIQIDNINNNDGGQMILRYGKFGLVCTWNLPQSKTYLTRRLSTASRSQICWFTVAWRHLIQTLWDQGINVDTELALLGSGHTQVITSLHIQCNVYFAVFISLQSRLCQCRHRRYVGGQKDENRWTWSLLLQTWEFNTYLQVLSFCRVSVSWLCCHSPHKSRRKVAIFQYYKDVPLKNIFRHPPLPYLL